MQSIPLFYFPTTLLIVDDDENLLELLQVELSDEGKLITIQNPLDVLTVVSQNKLSINAANFITNDNEDDIERENTSRIQFDFAKIIDIANDRERYNIISTLISDYSMPEMSGIELCKRLKDRSLKKILLTGRVDEQSAVEAFNWGIINRYVNKGDVHAIQELKTYIKEMVLQYFIEASEYVKFASSKLAILSDIKFIEFFCKIVDDNCIQEYYLIDKNGSFLLIDNNGKRSVLALATDEDLDEFSQFYQDELTVKKHVEQVKLKQQIPFFGIGINSAQIPLTEWGAVFFKANHLSCDSTTIYWSICPC